MRPIRTAAEVEVRFAIFTHEPFQYQRVAEEARKLRGLGMTIRAIGEPLGVDTKQCGGRSTARQRDHHATR